MGVGIGGATADERAFNAVGVMIGVDGVGNDGDSGTGGGAGGVGRLEDVGSLRATALAGKGLLPRGV